MDKRYLYDSKEFFYEIVPDHIYLTPDKTTIYIMKPHCEGGNNYDLEFDEGNGSSAMTDIVYALSVKQFKDIAREL